MTQMAAMQMAATQRPRRAWRIAAPVAICLVVALLPISAGSDRALAADGLRLVTRNGSAHDLPFGFPAFVDQLVSHRSGRPSAPRSLRDPEAVLGRPDRAGDGSSANPAGSGLFATGCRGEAVFAFTFNALMELPGPDLLIAGAPGSGAGLDVALSETGGQWRELGILPVGEAIDLAGKIPPRIPFRFIRIKDAGGNCPQQGKPPLVDAIAALQVALRSAVYFGFDSDLVAERSIAELQLTLGLIKPGEGSRLALRIEGHADRFGPAGHNMALSLQRAEQVATAARRAGIERVEVLAFGESRQELPSAAIPERWRNRRVEVIGFWERN